MIIPPIQIDFLCRFSFRARDYHPDRFPSLLIQNAHPIDCASNTSSPPQEAGLEFVIS
jgi:hypothetical protein